jgi:hypothetical protein
VSRYKGGTIIAEDVTDLATHQKRVCDPDGYRPSWCLRCGGHVLHVHDYAERRLRGPGTVLVVRIIRYLCADRSCAASWRILPAFIARHLWRAWPVVEKAAMAGPAPEQTEERTSVPASTVRRWRARLASSAGQLVQLLAASGTALLEAIAERVGPSAARRALVEVHGAMTRSGMGARLGTLGALAHRLERGIRLM